MKKIKLLFATLACFFIVGCSNNASTNPGDNSVFIDSFSLNDASTNPDDNSVFIDGFSLNDDIFSIKIDNTTSRFSFINKVHVPNNCYWRLYSDFNCTNEIISKTISCDIGHNKSYLLVDGASETIGFYTVDVYRLSMFTVSFDTDGGSYIAEQLIQEESCAIMPEQNPTKNGYSFKNWDYDFSTPVICDITILAIWNACKNSLTIISEDTDKGTVSIVSGSGYSGESISVIAMPSQGYVFDGWYNGNSKVSNNSSYTFIMPANDYSLVARFIAIEEETHYKDLGIIPVVDMNNMTVTYGLYPQTYVSDESLISALNSLTEVESNGWYFYNDEYYAKLDAAPYDSNYKFDDGTIIVDGRTYWFKCESITWKILTDDYSDAGGKHTGFYLLSSKLLDTCCYYDSLIERMVNGETVYPNNYEHSAIRKWLNDDFFNSAFSLGSEYVQTTSVDNTASTTSSDNNPYECNNTNDKIFLASYQDFTNSSYGFPNVNDSPEARYCKTTDYVRAKGIHCYSKSSSSLYNAYYWTRSPRNYDGGKDAHLVGDGWIYAYPVSSILCVRPAICFNFND